MATVLSVTAATAQTVVFVNGDAPDGGDGRAWPTAFNSLQPALDLAVSDATVTEMWVAAGRYRPVRRTDENDPRSATFDLINGVDMYGGFTGRETLRRQRDPLGNETILTGDLEGNDSGINLPREQLSAISRADNAYHVLSVRGTRVRVVVDGFTITAGQADGPAPLANSGGGLIVDGGRAELVNCHITRNAAGADGGGVHVVAGELLLDRCSLTANTALRGGGLANIDGSARLSNCLVLGNWAMQDGGGFHTESCCASVVLINCRFALNAADGSGGAIDNAAGDPILINCTFNGNTARLDGGGIRTRNGGPVLTNCILWGNRAGETTDEAAQISIESGTRDLTFSCVQGLTPSARKGTINDNPRFVREANVGPDGLAATADDDPGDLRLQPNSPCIDAGDNEALPPETDDDLAGRARRREDPCRTNVGDGDAPIVDMGAYEAVPRPGDVDCDGDTDLADLLDFQACFVGPGEIVEPRCLAFDLDGDGDIDLSDLVNFQAGFTGARAGDIRISAVLPNPVGTDARNEQVRFANATDTDLDLAGWKLQDRAGNEFPLVGVVPANGELTITMGVFSMPLNNTGDEVWLIDDDGLTRHRIAYERRDVDEGVFITFR